MKPNNRKAINFLKKADSVLGRAIENCGVIEVRHDKNYFRALTESIISQQLSVKASDTIFKRFVTLFKGKKFPKPVQVARTKTQKMRSVGISSAKVKYIKGLAKAFAKNQISHKTFSKLSDNQIKEELVKLKGIGVWTAEMFLIFSMGRPDVFSAGDLGLQNAVKKLYKLRKHPSSKTLHKISINWKPYRSLACIYLWKSL